jgi:hypothetical protein
MASENGAASPNDFDNSIFILSLHPFVVGLSPNQHAPGVMDVVRPPLTYS